MGDCKICMYQRRTSPRKQQAQTSGSPVQPRKQLHFESSTPLSKYHPQQSSVSFHVSPVVDQNDTVENAFPEGEATKKRTRGPSQSKLPLKSVVNVQNCKRQRLKPFFDFMEFTCKERHESKVDILFFMLRNELRNLNDRRADTIDKIWKEEGQYSLNADQSLSLRVDTLITKGQYKSLYDIFQQNLVTNVLETPNKVTNTEKGFLPGATEYKILDKTGLVLHHHLPVPNPVPVNVLGSFDTNDSEVPVPNVKGVRWGYADSLAQSLKEIDAVLDADALSNQSPDSSIITVVKDGGDGLGEVSVYKEQNDKFLPDKAFRFSFAIMSSSCKMMDGCKGLLYEVENPNSVRVNQPLLECIADENNKASLVLLLTPIERERQYLENKIISVRIDEDTWRNHEISFFNSMVDEKHDRGISGLQGSGSSHICVLCNAKQNNCKTNLGQFSIERTLLESQKIAEFNRLNPEKMPESNLARQCQGVKDFPITLSEVSKKLIDATHADINLGRFFSKLLVRLIAGVHQWEETRDVAPVLKNAQKKLDVQVKKCIGINPSLMMPGNYAREFFKQQNEGSLLAMIDDDDDRKNLRAILEKFRFLRSVYRATKPAKEDIKGYKAEAVEMGKMLINHFDFARWPNYLHKVIEHVQEILENPDGPGSIGAFSSEGNEGGNKLFRMFRKGYSHRGDSYKGLEDVLKLHWLYTSHYLRSKSKVTRRQHQCSSCLMFGHNKSTCTSVQE